MKVTIAIATYKRPSLLAELLDSIRLSPPPEGVVSRTVVVDNDAEGSARSVVEASGLASVTYVIEPRPGIAAVRNRGLDLTNDDEDAIVFVDDDERVHGDWQRRLVDGWRASGAQVVTGPVISVFAPGTPRWIVAGGFIQRDRHETGVSLPAAATNNTLMSLSFWRAAGRPRFDAAFSESGGSDTDFFMRLVEAGGSISWVDDAVVEEDVPAARARFSWIWRRAVRGGNVQARIDLRTTTRARLAWRLAMTLPYRIARAVVGLVRYRAVRAVDVVPLAWQFGKLATVFGGTVREYRRR
jgi:succinoglycan biosynthesis protein ExoM